MVMVMASAAVVKIFFISDSCVSVCGRRVCECVLVCGGCVCVCVCVCVFVVGVCVLVVGVCMRFLNP